MPRYLEIMSEVTVMMIRSWVTPRYVEIMSEVTVTLRMVLYDLFVSQMIK